MNLQVAGVLNQALQSEINYCESGHHHLYCWVVRMVLLLFPTVTNTSLYGAGNIKVKMLWKGLFQIVDFMVPPTFYWPPSGGRVFTFTWLDHRNIIWRIKQMTIFNILSKFAEYFYGYCIDIIHMILKGQFQSPANIFSGCIKIIFLLADNLLLLMWQSHFKIFTEYPLW